MYSPEAQAFVSRRNDRVSFELSSTCEDDLRLGAGTHAALATLQYSRHSLPVDLDAAMVMEGWQQQHPCALRHFDSFTKQLDGKRLVVFLDYDGTLTPIVSNPDQAVMSEEMRAVVRSLAQLFPTAIISGRGREKVEQFVQLKELFYAGSHGMDIAGPRVEQNGHLKDLSDSSFQPAAQYRPLIDSVFTELSESLLHIPGSLVEHNTFCVSAHFRNCEGELWQDVIAVVESIVKKHPQLRMTRGRKVCEIRPQVDWHKGTALNHLLDVLGMRSQTDLVAIYLGDDHTDEDAFRTLADGKQGHGILVTSKVKPTAARWTLREPADVQKFLSKVVEWGHGPTNAWLTTKGRCNAWTGHYPASSAAAT